MQIQRDLKDLSTSQDTQALQVVVGMECSRAKHANSEHFHMVTPLLESWALSQVAGTTVFLKCENVQPTGSFKIRGIGHFCQEVVKKGCRHLVCSSGGNAGLAAAYAARKLGIPATVVLPEGTSLQVVSRLQGDGAEVQLTGKVWDDANLRAQELAKRDGWVNVPPFDHPLIWEGHASLVRELKAVLGTPPGALVLAVGGGGLLAGVSAGLAEVGWQHVPVVAMETRGAHCFNAAVKAGRLVTLPAITSLCKKWHNHGYRVRGVTCICQSFMGHTILEHLLVPVWPSASVQGLWLRRPWNARGSSRSSLRWWRTWRPCVLCSSSWMMNACWWSLLAGQPWLPSTQVSSGGSRLRAACTLPWPLLWSSCVEAMALTAESCRL
ncbi:serine dehydratase-like isoform X2 [Manis javanica]|uniref:serine dehydratase-like isoform X2 n=2 Tax=Manis javanica TaxID=9974 RepID=UPI003C6CFD24